MSDHPSFLDRLRDVINRRKTIRENVEWIKQKKKSNNIRG